ncbi:MAG: histidine phosphatase family protein [Ferruginibacter sp.]
MKQYWLVCIICWSIQIAHAQIIFNKGTTTIYFVRHAEKEKGTNPILTEAGKQRAGDLFRLLRNEPIKRIYVTQYQRTALTADSLRILGHIDTTHYWADTTGISLKQQITEHKDWGKTLLVIGHSNTIPAVIKAMGYTAEPIEIADNAFDQVFILTIKKRRITLKRRLYGLPPTATAEKMVLQ